MNTGPVLVDVAVKDLSKAALDWVVGVIEGATPLTDGRLKWVVGGYEVIYTPGQANNPYMLQHRGFGYCPSTEWRIGGPLIEKYELLIEPPVRGIEGISGVEWSSRLYTDPNDHDQEFEYYEMSGPTALIAACRVIIDAKLGDIVKVPACLVLP